MSDLNCAECEPETGGAYCGACDIGHMIEGVREEARSSRHVMQPVWDEAAKYNAIAKELAEALIYLVGREVCDNCHWDNQDRSACHPDCIVGADKANAALAHYRAVMLEGPDA